MNFKKNEIEIIKLLISSTHYLTSYQISEITGINRRAIRVAIAKVKDILNTLGYNLISKPTKGYMIENKTAYSMIELSQIIEKIEKERESLFPILNWEKRNYVMKRLIDYNDYVKIDDLADELLLSRSALSSVIKEVRQFLKKYHLSLKQKPNYGICITGSESDKRKALCDFLFSNINQSEMVYDFLNSFILNQDSLEYQIINIFNNHNITFSDIALCDFLITISNTIYRILSNKTITNSPDISDLKDRIEFKAANEIAKLIEDQCQCHFNEFEVNEVAIEIICKRSCQDFICSNPLAKQITSEVFNEIYKLTSIDLSATNLKNEFYKHVEIAMLRVRFDEKIRTPIFDDVKEIYPLAYQLSKITAKVIETYTQNQLSKSTVSYFTTILNSALIQIEQPKKRALLICGLGAGTEYQGKYIIAKRFVNQFDIVKVTQFYNLDKEDLNDYDFIISTIPIHKKLSIPSINISQFITIEDLNKIDNYISSFFNLVRIETLFNPLLYKINVTIDNEKDLLNEFFKLIKKQFPDIKKDAKKILFNLEPHEYFIYDKVILINVKKLLYVKDILAFICLNEPIIYQNNSIEAAFLYSSKDNNHYVINTLQNTIKKVTNQSDTIYNIPYCKFIRILSKTASS